MKEVTLVCSVAEQPLVGWTYACGGLLSVGS